MFQVSEIGKYRGKERVFLAKCGKTFQLPSGREYTFVSYEKIGRKYLLRIEYLGKKCKVSEVNYNTDMENVLNSIEKGAKDVIMDCADYRNMPIGEIQYYLKEEGYTLDIHTIYKLIETN